MLTGKGERTQAQEADGREGKASASRTAPLPHSCRIFQASDGTCPRVGRGGVRGGGWSEEENDNPPIDEDVKMAASSASPTYF